MLLSKRGEAVSSSFGVKQDLGAMGVERETNSVLITVFQENYDQLVRFLTRKLGGDHDWASDIAQDTFMRLHGQSKADIAEINNPRAYIYRIAGNLAIDGLRRSNRVSRFSDNMDKSEDVQTSEPSPEVTVMGREALGILDQALSELPDNPRRALLMFRIEGMSHAMIAENLGVSESMVAKYLAQALRHCRDRLGQAGLK